MNTINLYNKPGFAEFLEDARIISAIQNDFNKHTRTFRLHIESLANQYADGDLQKFLGMADKIYARKISEVKTQEDYDVLFKGLYDEACLASVISNNMWHYCGIVEHWLNQIKYHDVICPCCGREIDDDVTERWQADFEEHKRLAIFYKDFYEARHKNLAAMRQLAQKKKFDPLNWQKDLKPAIGALARVEDIENEESEVKQILDERLAKAAAEQKRVALEMTENWLSGRSQN